MEFLLNGAQMRACDTATIKTFGVPSLVLMERAALACADALCDEDFDLSRTLVVCGSGNNGGDGFAIARILWERGLQPEIFPAGREENMTEDGKIQKKICENYGITFCRNPEMAEYTCIVDALFGVGLCREITGNYREWIEKINESPARVLAVDIPSGIHADNGRVMGCAVRADVTVTFAFRKIGHVMYPGAEYAGKVIRKPIGITAASLSQPPAVQAVTEEVRSWMPARLENSNKGTYGKALIAAGTRNMSGAAFMASKAAYRTGTGLVRILTEESNRICLQTLLPEAILDTLQTETEAAAPLERDSYTALEAVHWAGAVCIGPGYGTWPWKKELLIQMLHHLRTPLVLDADGLNLIAEEPEILENVSAPVILTPHPGEMARLLHCTIPEVTEDPIRVCREFARKYRVICILKGARTVISDGPEAWINETGNDGMATGGSGDVLAGIITGFLAQGCAPLAAAILGVYIHGLAGDLAREQSGARGMLAGEIIEALPEILKESCGTASGRDRADRTGKNSFPEEE
ncbi:MAG: NAD(P)H-hydrate dehydratase [Candidatus Limivivens sp.]|nr:NAD(P)H-hydrate dehydratase [Candidatus Limivivens sp.]